MPIGWWWGTQQYGWRYRSGYGSGAAPDIPGHTITERRRTYLVQLGGPIAERHHRGQVAELLAHQHALLVALGGGEQRPVLLVTVGRLGERVAALGVRPRRLVAGGCGRSGGRRGVTHGSFHPLPPPSASTMHDASHWYPNNCAPFVIIFPLSAENRWVRMCSVHSRRRWLVLRSMSQIFRCTFLAWWDPRFSINFFFNQPDIRHWYINNISISWDRPRTSEGKMLNTWVYQQWEPGSSCFGARYLLLTEIAYGRWQWPRLWQDDVRGGPCPAMRTR